MGAFRTQVDAVLKGVTVAALAGAAPLVPASATDAEDAVDAVISAVFDRAEDVAAVAQFLTNFYNTLSDDLKRATKASFGKALEQQQKTLAASADLTGLTRAAALCIALYKSEFIAANRLKAIAETYASPKEVEAFANALASAGAQVDVTAEQKKTVDALLERLSRGLLTNDLPVEAREAVVKLLLLRGRCWDVPLPSPAKPAAATAAAAAAAAVPQLNATAKEFVPSFLRQPAPAARATYAAPPSSVDEFSDFLVPGEEDDFDNYVMGAFEEAGGALSDEEEGALVVDDVADKLKASFASSKK